MPEFAKDLTLLGFDFGLRRIGVAVGQTITGTATPLDPMLAKNGAPNWEQVSKLIQTWKPDALIVGIPVNMDGSPQEITERAQGFATALGDHLHLPVYTVDERLTTKEAKQQLFDTGGYRSLEKASIDSFAAKLILETWLRK